MPVQCEYLSLRGLVQLENTLSMIRENLNPNVAILGILPTMFDGRTLHSREAIEILQENFGDLVFKTRIRKTIRYAEAPVKGLSVLKYEPHGKRGRGLPRAGEGGNGWRASAPACVRDRSPSCSRRRRRRSDRPSTDVTAALTRRSPSRVPPEEPVEPAHPSRDRLEPVDAVVVDTASRLRMCPRRSRPRSARARSSGTPRPSRRACTRCRGPTRARTSRSSRSSASAAPA